LEGGGESLRGDGGCVGGEGRAWHS
jgi:hypothetical protein